MKLAFTLLAAASVIAPSQELDRLPEHTSTRWVSFENRTGAKGAGGAENKGGKGDPFSWLEPGQKMTLVDVNGTGTIRRMWFTLSDRSPGVLRAIRIDIYWDRASKPAVSTPFGDFFCTALSQRTPFQNALFADPRSTSFNCYIPMPFRTGARLVVTNESKVRELMFYDVDMTREAKQPADAAYFHAFWRREPMSALGKPYEVLPRVKGKGRFLGDNIGIVGDPIYGGTEPVEGEVKIYLDGDRALPTLVGTGTEDYAGAGWGLSTYSNLYQGCTVADSNRKRWAFYRLHVPDPIYFDRDCRVTIDDIGGGPTADVRGLVAAGARLRPITVGNNSRTILLLDQSNPPSITDPAFPDGWVNFYRLDDYSSTAYFYLDKPASDLPPLPSLEQRTRGMG
ncbi:MAG: glycoside hydrolase family 172 protein [Fimbriimonadales bacterium]